MQDIGTPDFCNWAANCIPFWGLTTLSSEAATIKATGVLEVTCSIGEYCTILMLLKELYLFLPVKNQMVAVLLCVPAAAS